MKLLGHESPCWRHFHWEFRENSFSNKIDGSCIAYFIVQKVRFNSDYESTKVYAGIGTEVPILLGFRHGFTLSKQSLKKFA